MLRSIILHHTAHDRPRVILVPNGNDEDSTRHWCPMTMTVLTRHSAIAGA